MSRSLDDARRRQSKITVGSHSLPTEAYDTSTSPGSPRDREARDGTIAGGVREDECAEQCDIEPLSGTVFRKVTVRRRRQDMRKVPAIDNGEFCWGLRGKGMNGGVR